VIGLGSPELINGSRDLSGVVCHLWAMTCYVNQSTKFEVSTATHLRRCERRRKRI